MVTENLQNIKLTWTDYGDICDDRALCKKLSSNVCPEHMEGLRPKVRLQTL